MKKLDKVILQAFVGPFVLTFLVLVFILLMQYLLKYFDEIIGKNLGPEVYAELLFFFSINMTSLALPLAILISSLMTFGNLGEHFELTAIKSAGISLTRTLLPLGLVALLLSVVDFYNNDRVVPKANLKAYSLLYDIRQTKPALSLQEGSFYSGIPNYSIKVNKRYADDVSLKGVIIYDHSKGRGNTDIILADSGRMYTFDNEKYMRLEMFNGKSYSEPVENRSYSYTNEPGKFVRNNFYKSSIVFNLESFGLKETKEEYFSGNRVMKNVVQLSTDIDSMQERRTEALYSVYRNTSTYNPYAYYSKVATPEKLQKAYNRIDSLDRIETVRQYSLRSVNDTLLDASDRRERNTLIGQRGLRDLEASGIERPKEILREEIKLENEAKKSFTPPAELDTALLAKADSAFLDDPREMQEVYRSALSQMRYVKNNYEVYGGRASELQRSIFMWEIEIHKKFAQAAACFIMFLIGAPLGAIIKRGGLGVPVLVSIIFFIIFYVLTMFGDKWAREGIVSPELGMWSANLILLPFGLIFLWQARNDARLFESDFYRMAIARLRNALGEKVIRPELLRRRFRRHKS